MTREIGIANSCSEKEFFDFVNDVRSGEWAEGAGKEGIVGQLGLLAE